MTTITSAFLDAFNRRDVNGILDCFTTDVTYDDLFYGGFAGHDGLRRLFERMFREARHEWIADRVLVSPGAEMVEWTFHYVVSEAVPRSAGKALSIRGVSVFEVGDGRCRAYREYFDIGRALAEVGVGPAPLHRMLTRPQGFAPGRPAERERSDR